MKTQKPVAGLVGIALVGLALACDKNPPSAPGASKINASSGQFSASKREGDRRSAREEDQRFRWDIISVDFATGTLSAGGVASADANDGSKITLTGSGSFRVGDKDEVTGGSPYLLLGWQRRGARRELPPSGNVDDRHRGGHDIEGVRGFLG